jgi:hypothetical protein
MGTHETHGGLGLHLAAADLQPGVATPQLRVRIAGDAALAVLEAAEGSYRRLAGAECRKLFTDFSDGDGRPLQDRLDSLGTT